MYSVFSKISPISNLVSQQNKKNIIDLRFELTKYYLNHNSYKLVLPFGDFYLLEKFYVAEIKEGEHIGYDKLKIIFEELTSFQGKQTKIGVIANRINSYSTEPQVYNMIDEEFPILVASAFVTYNETSFRTATLEKLISNKEIKRCTSLQEALNWISTLKVLT